MWTDFRMPRSFRFRRSFRCLASDSRFEGVSVTQLTADEHTHCRAKSRQPSNGGLLLLHRLVRFSSGTTSTSTERSRPSLARTFFRALPSSGNLSSRSSRSRQDSLSGLWRSLLWPPGRPGRAQIHFSYHNPHHGPVHLRGRHPAELWLHRRGRPCHPDRARLLQGLALGGEYGGAEQILCARAPPSGTGAVTGQVGFKRRRRSASFFRSSSSCCAGCSRQGPRRSRRRLSQRNGAFGTCRSCCPFSSL